MTTIIDSQASPIAAIRDWLVALPCPACGSNPPETKGKEFVDGPGTIVECLDCKGTVRRFSALSRECKACQGLGVWCADPDCPDPDHRCAGLAETDDVCTDGRVEAFTLEAVHEALFTFGHIRIEYNNTNQAIVCRVLRGTPIPHAATRWDTIGVGGGRESLEAAIRALAAAEKAREVGS